MSADYNLENYQGFPEWVSCPNCGSDLVSVSTNYGGEIYFTCLECEHSKEPSFGVFLSKVK